MVIAHRREIASIVPHSSAPPPSLLSTLISTHTSLAPVPRNPSESPNQPSTLAFHLIGVGAGLAAHRSEGRDRREKGQTDSTRTRKHKVNTSRAQLTKVCQDRDCSIARVIRNNDRVHSVNSTSTWSRDTSDPNREKTSFLSLALLVCFEKEGGPE